MPNRVKIGVPPSPRFTWPERPPDWEPTISAEPGFFEQLPDRLMRGWNTVADAIFGETPQAQAENAIFGMMNPMGVGVTLMGSPLRNPAYRQQMLRALGKQIDEIEPSRLGVDQTDAQRMFHRLIETHPRIMSAFQHSGGVVRNDPAFTPEVVSDALARNRVPARLGNFTAGQGKLVPDLRDVPSNPVINITPESFTGAVDPSIMTQGIRRRPGLDMADTAAHETTHWAQRLGGRDAKRLSELIKQINAMADRKATVREALPLNIERRKLINRLEHGADTAGGNQAQRFQEYLKGLKP
jgi:hypothetical protein